MTVSGGKLYDDSMTEIPTTGHWQQGTFIQMPNDENQVYYFEQNKCHLINIKNRTTKDIEIEINTSNLYHLTVRHHDCGNMWLIHTFNPNTLTEYIVNSEGVKLARTHNIAPPMKNGELLNGWHIKLSKDCKHFTACGIGEAYNDTKVFNEVRYGNFDNKTGDFTCTAKHDFNGKFRHIYSTIIATDNSRVYYYGLDNEWENYLLLETPIVDGLPQYNQTKTVFAKKTHLNGYCPSYYAPDGKIYLFEVGNKSITAISLDSDGNTIYEEVYNFGTLRIVNNPNYEESWFMETPCDDNPPSDPCADAAMPDIHFENNFVCYGEPLNIVLPNSGTFTFSYTIDGEKEIYVNNITDRKYTMPERQGKFNITKFFAEGCEFLPQPPISAQIGAKVEKPAIIIEP